MDANLVMMCVFWAVLGTLVAALLAFLPGLHIYNITGLFMISIVGISFADWLIGFNDLYFTMFMVGLITGFSILFTLTTVYFSVPDDSAIFIIMPGQKYLLQGRAHEAVVLTGIGGVFAVAVIIVVFTLSGGILNTLRELVSPHLGWIILAVVVFILMSEWPKDFGTARTKLGRIADGWSFLVAGYVTFILAGILGMIVFYNVTTPPDRAFSSLMAPLVGIFGIPALLINIFSDLKIPKQHISRSVDLDASELIHGAGAGSLGGLFGAFSPGVTAGPASMLAGHGTGQRGDRPFVLSYAACRTAYYAGAIILFFTPLLHLRRGLASIYISLYFVPETEWEFYLVLGAMAISACIAFILMIWMSKLIIRLLERVSYQSICMVVLVVVTALVFVMNGPMGLLIMTVAAAIGFIPIMFHSRRLNLLAILLVPLGLNIAGWGPAFASFLGLL